MQARYFLFIFALATFCYGQQVGISRFVDFNFSENLSYSSNVFLADNQDGNRVEDLTLDHSFSVNHAMQRRFFSYSLLYNLGHRTFLLNDNFNFTSHSFLSQVTIPRKYYSVSIANNFSISSELASLEFNDFIVTYQNTHSMSTSWKINPIFNVNFATSYQSIRFPDLQDNDRNIYNFSLNTSYILNDRVSLRIGGQYTFVVGDAVEQLPSINLGLVINSQMPGIYWLDTISFDFGFTLNDEFDVPLLFNFNAAGRLTKQLSWSVNGSRDLTFSIIEDAQIQTNINISIIYQLNEYISPNVQIGFQHSELQDNNNLIGGNIATSYGYRLTNWSDINASYSFSTRDDGENIFFAHNVSFSITFSF